MVLGLAVALAGWALPATQLYGDEPAQPAKVGTGEVTAADQEAKVARTLVLEKMRGAQSALELPQISRV